MNGIPDKIKTVSCELTLAVDNDLQGLHNILQDKEVRKFLPEFYEIAGTMDDLKAILQSFSILSSNQEGYLWTIRNSDISIGFIAVIDIPEYPTIFYATHPDFRGQGFMKECLAAIVAVFRLHFNLLSLYSEVFIDNKISIKLLLSMGFIVMGKTHTKLNFRLDLKER